MEIYTKKLTYAQAVDHVAKAMEGSSSPLAARDEILYEILKNCAKNGNAQCMEQVLENNPDVDLDQRMGYLLLWSVHPLSLRQGRQGVEPFKVLLAYGADLSIPNFQNNLDGVRQGSYMGRPGDLLTYLHFVEKGLGVSPLVEGLKEDLRLRADFDRAFGAPSREPMLEAISAVRETLSLQRQFLTYVRPGVTPVPPRGEAPQA